MTVRLSRDEGKTWSVVKVIHKGPAAYSDLVVLPGGIVGCLYEQGDKHPYERVTFDRIPVEWLTDGDLK